MMDPVFFDSYEAAKAAILRNRLQQLEADVRKVGPHGYVHGWIKVGDSGAAASHGKDVAGDLGGGKGVVVGTYNHNRGTVTDAGGREHKVEAVNPERSEAGFRGDVASSSLPAGVRHSIEAYDRAVAHGVQTEAPGISSKRPPGASSKKPKPGGEAAANRAYSAAINAGKTVEEATAAAAQYLPGWQGHKPRWEKF